LASGGCWSFLRHLRERDRSGITTAFPVAVYHASTKQPLALRRGVEHLLDEFINCISIRRDSGICDAAPELEQQELD
jgi:hypothetical protein